MSTSPAHSPSLAKKKRAGSRYKWKPRKDRGKVTHEVKRADRIKRSKQKQELSS